MLEETADRLGALLSARGSRSPRTLHKALGSIMWDACGMSRTAEGLRGAIGALADLQGAFPSELRLTGRADTLNPELERAGRVADFLELGALMCRDALAREESCGGHFREEFQTPDGEALRDDAQFAHVAVWRHSGTAEPERLVEPLDFTEVALATRSYR